MATIAMIDDLINDKYLNHNRIKKRIMINDGMIDDITETKAIGYTHATICAMILERCADDYEIISIQIMKDKNTPTNIQNLIAALEICLELKPDIISMSIGTVILSDSLKLNNIIQELAKRNIIMVAALSNDGYLTLPASYCQVIGIQNDRMNILQPLEFVFHVNNPLGVKITANCTLDFQRNEFMYWPSNSYAVPVGVSYINKYINSNIREYDEILIKLNEDSNKDALQSIEKHIDLSDKSSKIPHVCIVGNNNISHVLCAEIINCMYQIHDIETAGFTISLPIKDIRFFQLSRIKELSTANILPFIEKYTTVDLIISALTKEEFYHVEEFIDIELIVMMKEKQVDMIINKQIVSSLSLDMITNPKEICQRIVDFLG